ncbi:PREDICTED: uncharacterized protein LOC109161007 isoform X2 [Ipomoea nil]|nr:PREDICTED: uncharacterized protein LOC109161007 isoform X2 [Ipomoea nil]
MRNHLSEDASSSNWPLFYGDRALTNGQYCNGFVSRGVMDAYPGYDKDAVKQKMLEHEAIFKNQVSELHRLYRIQRDMMQEVKRKEPTNRMSMEPSSSSNILGSQLPSEDVQKWHMTGFPLAHSSGYARASTCSTEIVNSPLSCAKGQSGRLQLQNGFSPKSCQALEARPSKVRKKLFDLHLPADQYIDTDEGEQLQDSKESFCPSYPAANGSFTIPQFLGGCETSDSQKDASMSNSCLRSAFGLADLNEPAQFEEAAVAPSSVNFLGRFANPAKDAKIPNVISKPNPGGVLASSREMMWNSHHGSSNGGLIGNLSVESKGKEREWLSYTYEAGNMKNNRLPVSQGFEQNKLPMQSRPAEVGILNKTHQNPGIYPTHGIRDELWRERTGYGFERARENSNLSRVEPVGLTGPSPFVSSSEFANSWSHSVSALGKPASSSSQKLTLFHSRNTQPSPSPITGGISRVNPGLGSDLPVKNGFYHGSSSSGSREPSAHLLLDRLNYNKSENLLSEHSPNHKHEKFLVDSNSRDSKSAKGFDLNVTNEAIDLEELVGNNERNLEEVVAATLPWLKSARPASKNEGRMQNNQNVASASRGCGIKAEEEIGETRNVKRILGVPILENPRFSPKNESSLLVSTSAAIQPSPEEHNRNEKKNFVIDMNMVWELSNGELEDHVTPEPPLVMGSKDTSIRNHIDLNFCIPEEDEEEDQSRPSAATSNVRRKSVIEIDLEAPAVSDTEEDNLVEEREASLQLPEHKAEQTRDEVASIAAEAIVAISSSGPIEEKCRDPLEKSLQWFANAVSSSADERLKWKSDKEIRAGKDGVLTENSCFEGIDYFEAMTLQLTETKEEDYMPKPFIPEFQYADDIGATSVPNRPRRGQSRRGRQRRDFQRDILPGLASLSRHEVTEDIQTFGGLMRATGHTWTSGLTRRNGTRNGGARGRRRTVVIDTGPPPPAPAPSSVGPTPLAQQLNNIEAVLEDKSLTGWGKTTRRPRRQRCPPAERILRDLGGALPFSFIFQFVTPRELELTLRLSREDCVCTFYVP